MNVGHRDDAGFSEERGGSGTAPWTEVVVVCTLEQSSGGGRDERPR
jgi:hypothetical protein